MKKTLATKKPRQAISVSPGSENLFEDLGFSRNEAAELKVKAELTWQFCRRIESLHLTQAKAALQLGLAQPDVSKLMNGRHTGFSVDRLLSLLNGLEMDIEIVLRPSVRGSKKKPKVRGTVKVVEAAVA